MDVIERINAEIQKKPDDRYTEIIGQYVIDRCAAAVDYRRLVRTLLKGGRRNG